MAHLYNVAFRMQKSSDSALVLAGDLNRSLITLHLAQLLELCHAVPLLLSTGLSVPAMKAMSMSGRKLPIFIVNRVHMTYSCQEIM